MATGAVKGVDLFVYLEGVHDHQPRSFEMTKKMIVQLLLLSPIQNPATTTTRSAPPSPS
jgi:hypothetical protein